MWDLFSYDVRAYVRTCPSQSGMSLIDMCTQLALGRHIRDAKTWHEVHTVHAYS